MFHEKGFKSREKKEVKKGGSELKRNLELRRRAEEILESRTLSLEKMTVDDVKLLAHVLRVHQLDIRDAER